MENIDLVEINDRDELAVYNHLRQYVDLINKDSKQNESSEEKYQKNAQNIEFEVKKMAEVLQEKFATPTHEFYFKFDDGEEEVQGIIYNNKKLELVFDPSGIRPTITFTSKSGKVLELGLRPIQS